MHDTCFDSLGKEGAQDELFQSELGYETASEALAGETPRLTLWRSMLVVESRQRLLDILGSG